MAALDTVQLTDMLKSMVTNCVVLGVFPGDMVPMKQVDGRLYSCADSTQLDADKHYCFILNTDAHIDPGEHWVAFFSNSTNTQTLEYFDSFGLPTSTYAVVYAALEAYGLAPMCKPVNTLGMLQSVQSTVCGHYCVAFLYWRAKHAHAPITHFAHTIADIGSAAQRDTYIVDRVRDLTRRSVCHTSQFGGAPAESDTCVCSQSCTCYTAK